MKKEKVLKKKQKDIIQEKEKITINKRNTK